MNLLLIVGVWFGTISGAISLSEIESRINKFANNDRSEYLGVEILPETFIVSREERKIPNTEVLITKTDSAKNTEGIGEKIVIKNLIFEKNSNISGESGRGIVDVQDDGLGSVSYIIHPDNLPPPNFQPIQKLKPLKEVSPNWDPEEYIKMCCSPEEDKIPPKNEVPPNPPLLPPPPPPVDSSLGDPETSFNPDDVDPKISEEVEKIALSMTNVPDEASSDLQENELPVKQSVKIKEIPTIATIINETSSVDTTSALPSVDNLITEGGVDDDSIMADPKGNSSVLDSEISNMVDSSNVDPTVKQKDMFSFFTDSEPLLFKLTRLLLDKPTPEPDSTNDEIDEADSEVGTVDDSLSPEEENMIEELLTSEYVDAANVSSNQTPRYEEEHSNAYSDVKSFLTDLAKSDGFQNAFLGDLIKNFGSLDQSALKLIYSLLIQPLTSNQEEESFGSQQFKRENGMAISPFYPSSVLQPPSHVNDLWRPLSVRDPKSPNIFGPQKSVDVVTAPTSNNFEVILKSSLNPASEGHRRPSKHLHFAQNRNGVSEPHQQPQNMVLGVKMPPPEALSALPEGSVLIPASQVLGRPVIPDLPPVPASAKPSQGKISDLFPNLNIFGNSKSDQSPPSKTGLSAIPSFLSYLFGGKRERPPPRRSRYGLAPPAKHNLQSYPHNSQYPSPHPHQPHHPPPPVFKRVLHHSQSVLGHDQQQAYSHNNNIPPHNVAYSQYQNMNYEPVPYSKIATQPPTYGGESQYINHSYPTQVGTNRETEIAPQAGGFNSHQNRKVDYHGNEQRPTVNDGRQPEEDEYTDRIFDYSNFYNEEAESKQPETYYVSDYESSHPNWPTSEASLEKGNTPHDVRQYTHMEDASMNERGSSHTGDGVESSSVPLQPIVDSSRFHYDGSNAGQNNNYVIPLEVSTFANLHEGYIYPLHDNVQTYNNPISNRNDNGHYAPSSQGTSQDYGSYGMAGDYDENKDRFSYSDDDSPNYRIEGGHDAPSEYDEFVASEGVPTDDRDMDPSETSISSSSWGDKDTAQKNRGVPHQQPISPSEFPNHKPDFVLTPGVGPVDVPEGTVIPKEDFERALNEQKYKNKFRRPGSGNNDEKQEWVMKRMEEELSGTGSNPFLRHPSLANDFDPSIAHLWNNVKLIPLQEGEKAPSAENEGASVPSHKEADVPPSVKLPPPSSKGKRNKEREKEKKSLVAYILIGSCVGLAVLSIGAVLVIVRFRKTCASRQIGGRTYLAKNDSLRALSSPPAEEPPLSGEGKSGHKLGSWFTGRNESLGTGKLRSNMTLPDIRDRSAAAKSGSTRDLLSLSCASSENSSPRHSQRSNASSATSSKKDEQKTEDGSATSVHRTASWLHREFASPSGTRGHETELEKRKVSRSRSRASEEGSPTSHSYLGQGGRPKQFRGQKKLPCLTSLDSEDLERATTRTSRYLTTDSELEDTNYELSDVPREGLEDDDDVEDLRRGFRQKDLRSMDSTDLGEELSRDLKVFHFGASPPTDRAPMSSAAAPIGGAYARSTASFTNDNVQNEVLLQFDNMLRQHTSPNRDANSGQKPPTMRSRGADPPPPLPPKPSRLSPDAKKKADRVEGGRLRAQTPPPSECIHSGTRTDDDRLV